MSNSVRSAPAWPYAFALSVAALLSIPTGLMLTLAGVDPDARGLATVVAFVVLSAGFLTYARCCLARPGLSGEGGQAEHAQR